MNRLTPDGPEVQVVVDEARRVLAQLGPDRAGGVANLLREIIAQGRDARVVLVDPRDPSRWIQHASLDQIGAPAEIRVQRTMQVLDRWRDVRESITMPGHYLAAFFDQVADATGGDGRDAAAAGDPRAHAGLGLPCDVCPGACTIDDPRPAPLVCDGGTADGPFPTMCGRDVVHREHPLGRPPATDQEVAVNEARAQIEEELERAGRHGLTAAELAERLGAQLVDQLPRPRTDLLTTMYEDELILAGGLPIHDRVVVQATGVQCSDCEGAGRNCGPHRTYEQRRRDGW
jgi:hypothetical protein